MLTLGLLAYHVLSFIPIPYTALLLVRSCASSLQCYTWTLSLLTSSQNHGDADPA